MINKGSFLNTNKHVALFLDSGGSFSIVIDYLPIEELTGGELRGEVTRFQVIDFQSPH